jgi:hypothetical protein
MTPAREPVLGAAESVAAAGPLARVPRASSRSEQALIAGALAGSESDLEALFRRHWPRAYRAAFLIVHDHAAAEDIAQEAFLLPSGTLIGSIGGGGSGRGSARSSPIARSIG